MQQEAKETEARTSKGPLYELFRKLPGRNDVAERVVEDLRGKARNNGDFTRSTVYNVIHGRSENQLIAEAFVRIAGEVMKKRGEIEAEARKLAA